MIKTAMINGEEVIIAIANMKNEDRMALNNNKKWIKIVNYEDNVEKLKKELKYVNLMNIGKSKTSYYNKIIFYIKEAIKNYSDLIIIEEDISVKQRDILELIKCEGLICGYNYNLSPIKQKYYTGSSFNYGETVIRYKSVWKNPKRKKLGTKLIIDKVIGRVQKNEYCDQLGFGCIKFSRYILDDILDYFRSFTIKERHYCCLDSIFFRKMHEEEGIKRAHNHTSKTIKHLHNYN